MSPVKTSPALKPTRRDRARATRLGITKAAYALFCERGYAGTTMVDIAEAAGVAVQTVYFAFHTKSELLSRTYDFAVLGEDEPLPPEQQPWYSKMTAEPDVRTALRYMVEGVGAILTRATPLEGWWAGGRAPILVVQPTADTIAPPVNAKMLQEDIGPRVTVVEIPGAGHALLPEQPEAVATAVIDHIRAR